MKEENRGEEIELGNGQSDQENMPNENRDQKTFKKLNNDEEIEDISISLDWYLVTEIKLFLIYAIIMSILLYS